MFDILTLSAIAFFVIMAIIIYVDRKNIEFKYIMVLRRTKRGIKIIDSIAKLSPKFWNFVGLIAIPICVLLMVIGVFLMTFIAGTIIAGDQDRPGVSLILPSLSSDQQFGLGGYAYFIPIWFWLILIVILLVPHEVFHGIIARAVKVPLKSVGLMLLLVLPGAFVEPDEKKLKNARRLDRLKVFSAGAFANVLTAVILFMLLNFVFQPMVVSGVGMKIYNVTDSSPAQIAGLQQNMTITEINSIKLDKDSRNPIGDIIVNQNLGPGNNISIKTDNKTFVLELAEHPENRSKPLIGITTVGPVLTETKYMSIDSALAVFSYTSMLIYFAVIVAIINLLPWKPFDGGLIFETLMEKIIPKKAALIAKISTMIILSIFLFNMFGPFLLRMIF